MAVPMDWTGLGACMGILPAARAVGDGMPEDEAALCRELVLDAWPGAFWNGSWMLTKAATACTGGEYCPWSIK